METGPPGEEAPSSSPIEVEVKFAVGPGTEAALAALGAVGLPHIPPFRDCYFDGPGAPLGRADVWLRHRQGQGWQLKLPHGDPRLPHGDPQQPHGDPQLPHGDPQQPHGDPQRPHGDPQRPHGDPQRPHGDPQLPHGDPRLPHSTAATHSHAQTSWTPPESAGSSPQLPHSGSEPPRSPPKAPHGTPGPRSTPKPCNSPDLPHSPPKPPYSPPDSYGGPKPHSPPDPYTLPDPHSPPVPHNPSAPHSPPKPHSPPDPYTLPDPHSPPTPHSPPAPHSPPPPPTATTAYREVWGDAGVLAELTRVLGVPSAPWGSVGEALGPLGLRPTASFVTRRRSARLGGLRVELDEADFGYGVGEVEEVAGGPQEVAAARRRVEGLCRALGAEPQRRVPGKLSVFLARHRPRYYKLLREAGRLEGLEEGDPPPDPQ